MYDVAKKQYLDNKLVLRKNLTIMTPDELLKCMLGDFLYFVYALKIYKPRDTQDETINQKKLKEATDTKNKIENSAKSAAIVKYQLEYRRLVRCVEQLSKNDMCST